MTAGSVLVIGAAGFIGRHVCRSLARQGIAVHGLGHGSWRPDEWASWGLASWLEADATLQSLTTASRNREFTALIHCAGTGAVAQSYSAPLADYERTVASTASLLEFARCAGEAKPRVVLASSAAVYGDQGDIDLTEAAARAPVSPYGFSKVAAENLCDAYSRFFGVQASIVRMFSVYGAGLRKQLLWDAMCKFSRGETEFFGTGHEWRDWIHVEDAAEVLAFAATRPQAAFEVFNAGHVKATIHDVLSRLAEGSGLGAKPRFTGETHVGNPRRLTSNSAHARRELGWQARIGLQEGLARYVDWFRTLSA